MCEVRKELREYGTDTASLLRLRDRLESEEVTHVAMEATGSYWKPVWHVLEGAVELVLANARDVKAVPGRESDVNDAEWITDLLAHGLARSSFAPPEPIDALDGTIAEIEARTEKCVEPFRRVVEHLGTIPGVSAVTVAVRLGRRQPEIVGPIPARGFGAPPSTRRSRRPGGAFPRPGRAP